MHINEFYDMSYGHSGCGCHNMFYNSDIKIRKFVYTDNKIRKINKYLDLEEFEKMEP